MRRTISVMTSVIALVIAGAAIPAAAATPAAPAAPCAGVGQPIPGGDGSTWNGCVDAGLGLNARAHQGLGPVSSGDHVVFTYPLGTKLQIDCFLTGPPVTGFDGATTTIWDSVLSYQVPGNSTVFTWSDPPNAQFSSDAWIFTGSDQPVVPKCNGHN